MYKAEFPPSVWIIFPLMIQPYIDNNTLIIWTKIQCFRVWLKHYVQNTIFLKWYQYLIVLFLFQKSVDIIFFLLINLKSIIIILNVNLHVSLFKGARKTPTIAVATENVTVSDTTAIFGRRIPLVSTHSVCCTWTAFRVGFIYCQYDKNSSNHRPKRMHIFGTQHI